MSTVRFFDAEGHPTAAQVLTAGYNGALLYGGTPAAASGKDFTATQYADYDAHGIQMLFMYELGTNDISGGLTAGQQHAANLIHDMQAKGASAGWPCLAVVDEHVAAANIELAVEYQRGFYLAAKKAGYFGPVGVYGFPEVTTAVHNAQPGPIADFYVGCGSRSAQPSFINIWQSNTGYVTVGGVQADDDQVLIPIPSIGVPDMELTDKIPTVKLDATGTYVGDGDPAPVSDFLRFGDAFANDANQRLVALQATVATLVDAVNTIAATLTALQQGQLKSGPYYLTDQPPTA